MEQVTSPNAQPVWDRFVRVFHWSLVSCVTFNYFVMPDGKTLHQVSGYLAVSLVVARIIWGFIGTRHARFADFFPTPSRLAEHVRQVKSGQHVAILGHNPVGAL